MVNGNHSLVTNAPLATIHVVKQACGRRKELGPLFLHSEDVCTLPNEMMAGHHVTGEEVLRDPVFLVGAVEQTVAVRCTKICMKKTAIRRQAWSHACKPGFNWKFPVTSLILG